jgi:hypothetical protein
MSETNFRETEEADAAHAGDRQQPWVRPTVRLLLAGSAEDARGGAQDLLNQS